MYELEDHNVLRTAAYVDTVKYQLPPERARLGPSRVDATSYAMHTGRSFRCIRTRSIRLLSLGELVGRTICRIVQESLSNAVRHANPTLITVSIDCQGEVVRVEITDDGRGMSEPSRPGYGLVGIGERVKAMGGRLSFSNKPGEGFAVAAVLPCSARREAACVPVQAVEL